MTWSLEWYDWVRVINLIILTLILFHLFKYIEKFWKQSGKNAKRHLVLWLVIVFSSMSLIVDALINNLEFSFRTVLTTFLTLFLAIEIHIINVWPLKDENENV